MYKFIEKGLIDHAGFFIYSKEEGTKAALFKNANQKNIVERRQELLYLAQEKNVINKNKKFFNNKVEVIVDYYDENCNMFVSRTEFSAPEVDTYVYIKSTKDLGPGDILEVNINEVSFDLVASI